MDFKKNFNINWEFDNSKVAINFVGMHTAQTSFVFDLAMINLNQ